MKNVFVGLVFVSVMLAIVSGDGPRGSSEHDSPELQSMGLPENELSRSASIQFSPRNLVIQSVGAGSVPDLINFRAFFKPQQPFFMRTFYFTRASDGENDLSGGLSMKVYFAEIFEWKETNATFNGFTPGVDPIIRSIDFSAVNVTWRNFTMPQKTVTSAGTVYVFVAQYPDPANPVNNLMTITVTFSDGVYSINGTSYSPSTIKVDVTIQGWHYADPNNYLGLLCKFQSSAQRERAALQNYKGEEEQEVNVGGSLLNGQPKVRWTWLSNVLSNNTPATVWSSPMLPDPQLASDTEVDSSTETGNMVYFSFEAKAPSLLLWDPAIAGNYGIGAAPAMFLLLALLSALLF